jgi:hypothetical protein
MSDDHAVRLTEAGPIAWRSIDNLSASQDDPYITGLSEQRADYLADNWAFEHVDASEAEPEKTMSEHIADILSGTLSDLDDALSTGAYDANLGQMESYEQEHKDRDGAYERIADRREDLEDETDERRDITEDES